MEEGGKRLKEGGEVESKGGESGAPPFMKGDPCAAGRMPFGVAAVSTVAAWFCLLDMTCCNSPPPSTYATAASRLASRYRSCDSSSMGNKGGVGEK